MAGCVHEAEGLWGWSGCRCWMLQYLQVTGQEAGPAQVHLLVAPDGGLQGWGDQGQQQHGHGYGTWAGGMDWWAGEQQQEGKTG